MSEFLPCPFCGEDKRLNYVMQCIGAHRIKCIMCGAEIHAPSKDHVFDKWNTRPNDAKKMIETDLRKGLRIKVPDSDYGIVTGWEMQKHTANGVKPYLRIDYDVYRSKCVGHGSTNLSSIEVCKQSSVEIEGE